MFTAQGASVTLNGTVSALITGLVRYPVYYLAEQVDAKLQGLLKIVNQPGVNVGVVSENSQFLRLLGVTNDGMPFDVIRDVTA